MRKLSIAALLVGSALLVGAANAADGCGPGCHSAPCGECVIDGWAGVGAPGTRVLNECPVWTRPRRPCPFGYVWKFGACFES